MTGPQIERRNLLSAGFVILGAGAAQPVLAAAPGDVCVTNGVDPADAVDPVPPRNFKKGAQVDARYPMSYRRSVPAACRVLTAHFDAIANRDYAALANTLHFPFAVVERLDPVVVNSPAELRDNGAPASLNFTPRGVWDTDHFSRLKPGMFDILISLEVINFDACHVNMAMTYDRFDRHGIRNLRCEGVYCVTNNDGKWAIQLMSTIWTPNDLIGRIYQDAQEAAMRLRINHVVSYADDTDIIDRPRPHRGPTVTITGGGIGNLFNSQQGDDPTTQFRIKGVKSRLGVRPHETAGEALDPAVRPGYRPRGGPDGKPEPKYKTNLREYNKIKPGDYFESALAPQARIIHQSADKVHRYAGASRFTPSGELMSVSAEVAVIVLGTGGDWVPNANFRYATTIDRYNDDWT